MYAVHCCSPSLICFYVVSRVASGSRKNKSSETHPLRLLRDSWNFPLVTVVIAHSSDAKTHTAACLCCVLCWRRVGVVRFVRGVLNMSGYDDGDSCRMYEVEPGDTFYSIAQQHYCPLQAIHDANPSLDVERLQVS